MTFERVPMVKGRVDKSASTATAYCRIIYSTDGREIPTRFYWIAPCRARLERPGDYDAPEGSTVAPRAPVVSETTIPGVTAP